MKQRAKTVLFIDKDKKLADMITSFLYMLNYQVAYAFKVKDGLSKLERQKYDCILIDPDFEKDELLGVFELLSDKSSLNFHTPIIFATFNLKFEVPQKYLHLIKLVMHKPLIAGKVVSAIELVTTEKK